MEDRDEVWTRKKLHAHYQRHKKGHVRLDPELLEILRARHWNRVRETIANEVCAIVATILTPPEALRACNHETGTMLDAHRTERVKSEPLR